MVVRIPFGIDSVDRNDCNGEACDPTVDTDYGAPVWDEDVLDISDE